MMAPHSERPGTLWATLVVTAIVATCLKPVFAETDFLIDATLSGTYSDNVRLEPDDLAEDDFVTGIRPGFRVDHRTGRFEARVEYGYEALFYAQNSDLDSDFHQADLETILTVFRDEVTLEGTGTYTQVNIDPTLQQTNNNINDTGNRTDGYALEGGPRWQRTMPFDSLLDTSFHAGIVRYDEDEQPGSVVVVGEDELDDVDTKRFEFLLESDRAVGRPTNYELRYNYWTYDYGTNSDVENQNLVFRLSQEVRNGLELVGLAGLDNDFSDPTETDSSLSETRWELGFDYAGNRGSLMAMAGDRYFGTVYRFEAGYRGNRWEASARYDEEPGTTEEWVLQRGPLNLPSDDGSFGTDSGSSGGSGLERPGTANRFLQKRLEGTARWQAARSELDLTAWWDKRTNLDPVRGSGGNVDSVDESTGVALTYRWDIGAKTTLDFSGSWEDRSFDEISPGNPNDLEERPIEEWNVDLGFSYELGHKTSLRFRVGYLDSDRDSDLNLDDYDEWQGAIEITRVLAVRPSRQSRNDDSQTRQ